MKSNNSVGNNESSGGTGFIVLLIALVAVISFLQPKGNPNSDTEKAGKDGLSVSLSNTSLNENSKKRIEVTDDEFYWLTMLVCCEGGHEPRDGQVAIVATVLNRLEVGYNGAKCIADVVFDPYQYSCVWDWNFHLGGSTMYYSNLIDVGVDVEAAEDAVRAALNGEDPTREALGGGAYYYYNPECTAEEELTTRQTITKQIRIGNHVFYRVWD